MKSKKLSENNIKDCIRSAENIDTLSVGSKPWEAFRIQSC